MAILLLAAAAGLPILSSSCNKKSTEPDQFNYPDSNISYQRHIQPIFRQDCYLTTGCHSTVDRAGGLNLESDHPTFISDHGVMVFPEEADQSPLYLVLLGPYNDISRMPKDSPRLPDAKINAIKLWINEGAHTTY